VGGPKGEGVTSCEIIALSNMPGLALGRITGRSGPYQKVHLVDHRHIPPRSLKCPSVSCHAGATGWRRARQKRSGEQN
jgi:hypothetical protein